MLLPNHLLEPKFKVEGHVRISKYQNIFPKGYTQK